MAERKKTTTRRKTTAKKIATPRKKRLKLTEKERTLLEYPPTERTWICDHSLSTPNINPGSATKCLYCGADKPKKPELLWPKYVELCSRVGIEPGFKWKMFENGKPMMRTRTTKWQEAPEI